VEIIYLKDEKTSMHDFLEEALTNDIITGVFLSGTITKDNIPVVLNPTFYEDTVGVNYTFAEIQQMEQYDVISLEEILNILASYNKKIVLNVLPIYLFDVTQENLEEIIINAREYMTIFKSVLDLFPNENIYICTPVQRSLFLLQEIIKNRKVGLVVTMFNLTYVDIDFYVFDIKMVNMNIIIQELNRMKELMIATITRSDIQMADQLFSTPENALILDQLQFITDYPNELHKALTD
jgi:hypothetical protein